MKSEIDKILESIKELRESQKETDRQIRETSREIRELKESQKETDRQIRASQKETDRQIRASQKETGEQIKETDRQIRKSLDETNGQIRKTQIQLDENAGQIKKLQQQLGSIGFNNGDFAEEIFFRGFEDNPVLGGIKYDRVERRMKRAGHKTEFDIILINGQYVAVIEVKYKAHPNEIGPLIQSKAENFKFNFAEFKDHILHFGIASLVTHPDLEEIAAEEGIYLLTQKGDHMEVINSKVREF